MVALVSDGPFSEGVDFIEFERYSVMPNRVARKLGPCRRMAGTGRPLPLLMVRRNAQAEEHFRETGRGLPMLTATQESAFAGPLTGSATVWRLDGTQAALHCRG